VEILVTPSSATLTQMGETVLLSAQVSDAAGQEIDAEFSWQSSRPNQLEVDQTGQVMALGGGSAEIWAEASGVESPPSMLDMILVDPNAYVTNTAAGVVSVIDTLTDAVLATLPVGASPTRVAVTRDGVRVYVANTGRSREHREKLSLGDRYLRECRGGHRSRPKCSHRGGDQTERSRGLGAGYRGFAPGDQYVAHRHRQRPRGRHDLLRNARLQPIRGVDCHRAGYVISVIDTETDTLATLIGVDAVPTGLAASSAQALAE
jgi:YVTN family beta-propeller protein